MGQFGRPFLYSACDRYLTLILGLVMTAIVARLLTPDELGLFALISGVVFVSEGLREFGAGAYIIQERVPSRTGVRAAFTMTLAISALLALALIAAAGPISAFYGEPRLADGLRLASLMLILNAFAAPPMAVLRRDLDFLAVAVINVSGAVVLVGVTVGLILLGHGYMSLIIGQLVAIAYGIAATQIHRPTPWLFRPHFGKAREMAAFGGWISATSILNNLYVMLPTFVLPRVAGFEAVALFSRATQLAQLSDRVIVGAIVPVILPAFANLARRGEDLRHGYLHGIRLITVVQWPALLGLAILAEPVVRIVLGDQWDAAAGLLRILALAGLFVAPAPLTFPVLVALGHTRDTLTTSLISLSFGAIVFAIFARYGLRPLALSFLISLPVQMFVALVFIRYRLGFGWREFFGACLPSAVCAALSGVPPLLAATRGGFSFAMSPAELILAIGGGGFAWLIGLALTRHPLMTELRKGLTMSARAPI